MRPKDKLKNKTGNKALALVEKKKGWDWGEFADQSGIERQVVRMWLLGHKNPSISSLNAVSLASGVTLRTLLDKSPTFNLSAENNLVHFNLKGVDIESLVENKIISRKIAYGMKQGQQPTHKTLSIIAKYKRCRLTDLLFFPK